MISSPRRAATMPNRKSRAASKSESVIDDTGLYPTHAAACEPFVRVAGLSCPPREPLSGRRTRKTPRVDAERPLLAIYRQHDVERARIRYEIGSKGLLG